MKKVLLATTNKDKYSTVSKIFKATIFPDGEYQIDSLKTINVVLEDKTEEGDNVSRARTKAMDAFNALKDYDYDYIVGLDDAIRTKGVLDPNIKKMINKILYEHYLEDDEEYSFSRAYSLIDRNGNLYEVTAEIPYKYRYNPDAIVEEHTYPLSQVACLLDSGKKVCDVTEDEALEYYLKYIKDDINKLNLR